MEHDYRGYDFNLQAEIVDAQIKAGKKPVEKARNLISDMILSNIILALSDCGFYEYAAGNETLDIKVFGRSRNLAPDVLEALTEYLAGRGLIVRREPGKYAFTEEGRVIFNIYTRGVANIYLGGYKEIFHRLTDMLSGKVRIGDPSLERSSFHAAAGTSQATITFTLPAVMSILKEHKCYQLLDLGCGTGDFIFQFLHATSGTVATGADMSREAINQATNNAERLGFKKRADFRVCEVGKDTLDLRNSPAGPVDIVTSMYMVHEFGRSGDGKVVEVLRWMKDSFPSAAILLVEVDEIDPHAFPMSNPKHFGKLDYRLIHVLSGQGLPRTPDRWQSVFATAGLKNMIEPVASGGSYIYLLR